MILFNAIPHFNGEGESMGLLQLRNVPIRIRAIYSNSGVTCARSINGVLYSRISPADAFNACSKDWLLLL